MQVGTKERPVRPNKGFRVRQRDGCLHFDEVTTWLDHDMIRLLDILRSGRSRAKFLEAAVVRTVWIHSRLQALGVAAGGLAQVIAALADTGTAASDLPPGRTTA